MISKGKLQRYVRKSHRYLGLFLGVQFLAWTLGLVDGESLQKSSPLGAAKRCASFYTDTK